MGYAAPNVRLGGACMAGSIHRRKDTGAYFVLWYDPRTRRGVKITRYLDGEVMRDKRYAAKLLSMMQGDVERGVFRLEKYTGRGWTDVVPYLWDWLEVCRGDLAPATFKDYHNSIKNHLEPFFQKHRFQLHEIQYDVLRMLLAEIARDGKGKRNVMFCLHACLKYAHRSGRIPEMPPFPEKKHYNLIDRAVRWLPTERQMAVINAIPEAHRPIFLWLKYHLRRPAEACALHKQDFDPKSGCFVVRRSISARQMVNRTKTNVEHIIPCHPDFAPLMPALMRTFGPHLFTCGTSRQPGQRYTHTIMSKLWRDACRAVGEDIGMYAGLKHSSCSQYVNEHGLSLEEVKALADHANIESTRKYARVEVSRKMELYERGRVVRLNSTNKEEVKN
jgi:integrase